MNYKDRKSLLTLVLVAGCVHQISSQGDDTFTHLGHPVVNGHTRGPVETWQQQPDYSSQEPRRPNSRRVFSPNLKDDHTEDQASPPGLHIHTADWSRNQAYWNFKGGDWSMVDLPSFDHPTIQPPILPGQALVVVTTDYLKKVYVQRHVAEVDNITLHYSFYLSEGHPPDAVPELKVYQVTGTTHKLLASESTRGSWSFRTLILQQPGPTTIVFEGRLNKEGNEIALDDLTISWVSKKEEHEDDTLLQVSSEADILTFLDINDTSKTTNETVAPAAGKAGEAVHSDNSTWQAPEGAEEDTSTPILANPEAVTLTPEVTSEILDRGDEVEKTDEVLEPFVTTTAPDSHPSNVTSATPAGEEEGVQGNNTTAHILSEHQDGTSENPDQLQTSVDIVTEVSEFVSAENVLNTTDSDLNSENKETSPTLTHSEIDVEGNETYSELNPDGNETHSELNIEGNKTTDYNDTMSSEMFSGVNNTGELPESTLAYNDTNEPENITSPVLTYPFPVVTLSTNDTTPDPLSLTEPSTYPQTSTEAIQKASTKPEGYINFADDESGLTPNITSYPVVSQTSQSTTILGDVLHTPVPPSLTPLISTAVTSNSTATAGGVTTIAPAATGEMPMSRTSWEIFQIFLVLCLFGLVVLGFLYWRKRRRQDDEIPMFTRSYADYQNPTFTPEDDSSFASHGGRPKYNSFE